MAAAVVGLADGRRDGGRLQPVEPRFQALIAGLSGPAPGEAQDFVGRGSDQPGGRATAIARLDNLAGDPDQHIGIPDGRHAMFGRGFDQNRDSPIRKSIGRTRLDLARLKKGQVIRS